MLNTFSKAWLGPGPEGYLHLPKGSQSALSSSISQTENTTICQQDATTHRLKSSNAFNMEKKAKGAQQSPLGM